jgi:ADP-heptose:LPS heptosyltransferase
LRKLKADDLSMLRKILVIQLGPYGDALLTTSYFEALRRRLPQVKLFYLVKEPYDRIIRDHPLVDAIIAIRKRQGLGSALERLRTLRAIRREGFDLVIDQQNKPSSQQLTFLSGARYRLGYADARFSWAYNLKAGRGPLRYSANRKFDILGPLGIPEEAYRLHLPFDPEAERYVATWLRRSGCDPERSVCISPGSPVRKKRWRPERFAGLADSIQTSTGNKVILLWGPGEVRDLEEVRAAMRTEPVVAPPTDLDQAAALVKLCRLLVCNDGGLNHIAAALGTPTLAVFGTTDPRVWSPASVFGSHHHLYKPGFDSAADDAFGISVDEAFTKVKEILAHPRGDHGA